MDASDFVRQIIEDPFDEALRLVFADYLEEGEDARSELIRVQLEKNAVPPWDPMRLALLHREQEAQQRASYQFFGQLPDGIHATRSDGGFFSGVTLSVTAFLKNRKTLFQSAPVTTLKIDGRAKNLKQLSLAKELSQIEDLTLSLKTNETEISQFFQSPNLKRVRSLTLESEPTPLIIDSILQSAFADRLEAFALSNVYRDNDWLAEAFASAKNTKLLSLDLGESSISEHGLQSLMSSDRFAGLRSLQIRGTFDSAALSRFQNQARCRELVRLSVAINPLRPEAFNLLQPLPELRWLKAAARLESSGLPKLAENYPNLQVLELPNNTIDDEGVNYLIESGSYERLLRLDLRQNQIGCEGMEELGFEHNGTTEVLLDQNPVERDDIEALRKRFGTSFGRFTQRYRSTWE